MKKYGLKKYSTFFVCSALMFYGVGPVFSYISSGGEYGIESSALGVTGGQLSSGGEYTAKGALSQAYLPSDEGVVLGGEYVNRTGFYNPPYFTYQKGLPVNLSFESGNVELFLPANSVDKNVFDVTVNKNVINDPIMADSSKVARANSKMVHNEGAWSALYPNNISELCIFDEQDVVAPTTRLEGSLAMYYDDIDNNGILDGSNPPVRVDTLQSWVLDDEF